MIVLLITSAFNLGWIPFSMSLIKNEITNFFMQNINIFYFVLIIMAFILTLFSKELIVILLPDNYRDSINLIGPLSGAIVFDGMLSVIAVGLYIKKKTHLLR
jgi:O-antigen/teichoic acid export membrane protein